MQRGKGERCPCECRVQRRAKRDRKAFLSDQRKEIEANRMGKARALLRKLEIPREHFMKDGLDKGQKW